MMRMREVRDHRGTDLVLCVIAAVISEALELSTPTSVNCCTKPSENPVLAKAHKMCTM